MKSHHAAERTEKEFFLQPVRLKKFTDQLLRKEMIDKVGNDSIMYKSKKGELRHYYEVLAFLKNFVIINPANYSQMQDEFIDKVYRKTSTVLPQLL